MNVRRLSRDEARRIAVRAQLLDADRPAELLEVADRLTLLQLDPTAAIAPSADLVAEPAGQRLPARTHAPGARARPHALRASGAAGGDRAGDRDDPAHGRSRSPSRRHGRGPALRVATAPRVARRQRRLPPACSRSARHVGPACLSRDPRHCGDAVGVVGLDARPQRHADARVPGHQWRSCRRWPPWPTTSVEPRRPGLPG